MVGCSEDFFCGKDFDTILAILRSYNFDANASKVTETIAWDEKDDHKCSFCVIVCIATA